MLDLLQHLGQIGSTAECSLLCCSNCPRCCSSSKCRVQPLLSTLSISGPSALNCVVSSRTAAVHMAVKQTPDSGRQYAKHQPCLPHKCPACLLCRHPLGASVIASGQLVASPGSKQAVEIKADKITLVGSCDPESYPLQKVRPAALSTLPHNMTSCNCSHRGKVVSNQAQMLLVLHWQRLPEA